MLVSCPCLNLSVDVLIENQNGRISDENNLRPPENLVLNVELEKSDEFFVHFDSNLIEVITKDENSVYERIPVLVEKRVLAGWEIRKCIVCDLEPFAINTSSQTKILLKKHLLKSDLNQSCKVSEIFNLILPSKSKQFEQAVVKKLLTNSEKNAQEEETKVATISESLQQLTIDYLKGQQEIVEDRIQKFTEEQHAILEKIKEEAKQEKQHFISYLFGQTCAAPAHHNRSDDGADSALALSPSSIVSTGGGGGDASTSVLLSVAEGRVVLPSKSPSSDIAQNVLRPKTNSNPISLSSYKRKRHSGGSTRAPMLSTEEADENQGVFCLDEQDTNNDDLFPPQWHTGGDELDTDDSGHGEDYGKYYPLPTDNVSSATTVPPLPNANDRSVAMATPKSRDVVGYHGNRPRLPPDDDDDEGDDFYSQNNALNQFGTSLPVKIPLGGTGAAVVGGFASTHVPQAAAMFARMPSTDEDRQPEDVGASMQALARSIQAVDDPERLFGERPRRRWKTGEIVPATASRNFVVSANPTRNQPQPF